MRLARWKADKDAERAHYHCISRVIERRFALHDHEKEKFLRLMRGYEAFCGVKVVTFCIMTTHFHLLVEVPKRPPAELLPDDSQLVALVKKTGCPASAATLEQQLGRFREAGQHDAAEKLRERFFARMWDVSSFMKLLKQRFSHWFNRRTNRKGTLWEERFKSVLVEGGGAALAIIAAYVDLNPIRAGMVADPKDYRWSGYGEAVGGGRLAREGLRVALEARWQRPVVPQRVMAEYRCFLFDSGSARQAGSHGEKARKGFTREEIKAVIDEGGKLELAQALHCRVRYFCDGAIFGSRAFVERFLDSHREYFGPRRTSLARELRGIQSPGLYVGRALRVQPLGQPLG